MKRSELIALMGGYSYVIKKEYLAEYKTRFVHEEGRGIIDVWMGRKGTTLGVYDPGHASFWFKKHATLDDVENALIWVQDYYRKKHGTIKHGK